MTIQTIGVGSAYNDKTGDKIRDAFTKVNDNFSDSENAASRLVQSSPTDTTAGRLMAVGAAGWLGSLPEVLDTSGVNYNSLFRMRGDDPNNPTTTTGFLINLTRPEGLQSAQLIITEGKEVFVAASSTGDLSNKYQIFTNGNYQPELASGYNSPRWMTNKSGSAINSGATISGSSLQYTLSNSSGVVFSSTTSNIGTWLNVAGANLANNESGLFVRIS